MNIRNPVFPWLALCITLNLILMPSVSNGAEDGGLPGYFLSQGAGARALGMGRSYAAVSDDASAIFWNPGGSFQLERKEFQYMYVKLFEDTVYNSIEYVHPGIGALTFGLGAIQMRSDNFIKRDDYNNPGETFSDQNTAIVLNSCFEIDENLGVGINLKSINKKIDTYDKSAYDADAGFLYKPLKELSVGLNIQNLVGAEFSREILTEKNTYEYKIWRCGEIF